jgi:hypothetical protein
VVRFLDAKSVCDTTLMSTVVNEAEVATKDLHRHISGATAGVAVGAVRDYGWAQRAREQPHIDPPCEHAVDAPWTVDSRPRRRDRRP